MEEIGRYITAVVFAGFILGSVLMVFADMVRTIVKHLKR